MEKLFEKLTTSARYGNKTDESISNGSVGWQIDHSLNVIFEVCKAISKSDPSNYEPRFKLIKSFVMLTGYIPRGKAKAPKTTSSDKESFSETFLLEKINYTKEQYEAIKQLDKGSYFNHPLFGDLNLKDTLKFLEIHTHHHVKIIEDILS